MTRVFLIAATLVACGASTAYAQVSTPNAGEVIITPSGKLLSPWVEQDVCENDACRKILLNTVTHEIARVDGRLTSIFELSGNQQEVRRAESAMDKALRLQAHE